MGGTGSGRSSKIRGLERRVVGEETLLCVDCCGSLMSLGTSSQNKVPKIKDVGLQQVDISIHRPFGIQNSCKDTSSFQM